VKSLVSLVAFGLMGLGSCKPAPGRSCRVNEARCLDPKRELVCDPELLTFIEMPCKGKAGCVTAEERTSCDVSGNAEGDPCSKADEGIGVCAGSDAMLACHDRKFERVPCRGPRGCAMLGEQPSCDQSIAEAGESCKKAGAQACSVDGNQVLLCSEGKLTMQYVCRGQGRCSSTGGKLSCDQTIARLGDGCDKKLSGHIACSEDKKALITCQNERFVSSEKCKPGTLCSVLGQSTKCDRP
jgi:hypothetical protein